MNDDDLNPAPESPDAVKEAIKALAKARRKAERAAAATGGAAFEADEPAIPAARPFEDDPARAFERAAEQALEVAAEDGEEGDEAEGAARDAARTEAFLAPDDDPTRLVEALIFASPEPLPAAAIAERLGESVDVGAALGQLKKRYAGRGFQLVEAGGGWRFQTSPDLAGLLAEHRTEPRRLSQAAIETLAIIAYHQPVTRAEIESVRGVAAAKGTLDQLVEIGWVRPGRRRRSPGKPLTFLTTEAFLAHFGLSSIEDLPGKQELKEAGLLTSDLPDDMEFPNPARALEAADDADADGGEHEFVADFGEDGGEPGEQDGADGEAAA